jgi:hypothetical protein
MATGKSFKMNEDYKISRGINRGVGNVYQATKATAKGTQMAGKGTILAGKGTIKATKVTAKATKVTVKGTAKVTKGTLKVTKGTVKGTGATLNAFDEILGGGVGAAITGVEVAMMPVIIGKDVVKTGAKIAVAPVVVTGKVTRGTVNAVNDATKSTYYAASDATKIVGGAAIKYTGVTQAAKASLKATKGAAKLVTKAGKDSAKFTLRTLASPEEKSGIDVVMRDGMIIPDLSLDDLMGEVYAHSENELVHKADVECEAAKVVADNLMASLLNQFEISIEEWDLALEYLNMEMNLQNHNPEILSHIDHINEYKYDVYITAAQRLDEFYEDIAEIDDKTYNAGDLTGSEGLEALLASKQEKQTLLLEYRTNMINFEETYAKKMFDEVHELQTRSPLSYAFLRYWKQHDRMATFAYNAVLDLDKQIDKEITRMPLAVLCEFRRELTTEAFSHGVGRMPHFNVPSMIASHTFLRAPEHDDAFWTYRVDEDTWKHAKDGVRPKPCDLEQWVAMPDIDNNLVPLYCVVQEEDIVFYDKADYLEYTRPMLVVKLADLTGVVLSVNRDDPLDETGLLQRTEVKLLTEYAVWRIKFPGKDAPGGDADVPVNWWRELLAARKHAIKVDDQESKYSRMFNRRLFPRNGQAAMPGELPLWKQMEGMAMATRDASGTALKAGAIAMLRGTDLAAGLLIDGVHGTGQIMLKGTVAGTKALGSKGLSAGYMLSQKTLENSILFTKSGLQISRKAVKDIAGVSTRGTLLAGAAAIKFSRLAGTGAFLGGKLASKVGIAGLLATKDGAMKGAEGIGGQLFSTGADGAVAMTKLAMFIPKLGLKAGAIAAVGTMDAVEARKEKMLEAQIEEQRNNAESAIKDADELIAMRERVEQRRREAEEKLRRAELATEGIVGAEQDSIIDQGNAAAMAESDNMDDARRRIASEKEARKSQLEILQERKKQREAEEALANIEAKKEDRAEKKNAKATAQGDKKVELARKKAELQAKKSERSGDFAEAARIRMEAGLTDGATALTPEEPALQQPADTKAWVDGAEALEVEVPSAPLTAKEQKKADLAAKKAALDAKKAQRKAGGTVSPMASGNATVATGDGWVDLSVKEQKQATLAQKKAMLAAKKEARKTAGLLPIDPSVANGGMVFAEPEMAAIPGIDPTLSAKDQKKAMLAKKKAMLEAKKTARKTGGVVPIDPGLANNGQGFVEPEMAAGGLSIKEQKKAALEAKKAELAARKAARGAAPPPEIEVPEVQTEAQPARRAIEVNLGRELTSEVSPTTLINQFGTSGTEQQASDMIDGGRSGMVRVNRGGYDKRWGKQSILLPVPGASANCAVQD